MASTQNSTCRTHIVYGRQDSSFPMDQRSPTRANHLGHLLPETFARSTTHTYSSSTCFPVCLMIISCREGSYFWPWQLLISRGASPFHFWKTSGQSSRYVCINYVSCDFSQFHRDFLSFLRPKEILNAAFYRIIRLFRYFTFTAAGYYPSYCCTLNMITHTHHVFFQGRLPR